MNVDVKAVHFELFDKTSEYLDKKLERLAFAKDYIVDLKFVFKKDKEFTAECTINFNWGTNAFMQETDFELNAAIDKLIDKAENKIHKEREKVKEHNK